MADTHAAARACRDARMLGGVDGVTLLSLKGPGKGVSATGDDRATVRRSHRYRRSEPLRGARR